MDEKVAELVEKAFEDIVPELVEKAFEALEYQLFDSGKLDERVQKIICACLVEKDIKDESTWSGKNFQRLEDLYAIATLRSEKEGYGAQFYINMVRDYVRAHSTAEKYVPPKLLETE